MCKSLLVAKWPAGSEDILPHQIPFSEDAAASTQQREFVARGPFRLGACGDERCVDLYINVTVPILLNSQPWAKIHESMRYHAVAACVCLLRDMCTFETTQVATPLAAEGANPYTNVNTNLFFQLLNVRPLRSIRQSILATLSARMGCSRSIVALFKPSVVRSPPLASLRCHAKRSEVTPTASLEMRNS